MAMKPANEPSTGRQIGVTVALLVIDFMVIAWMVYDFGMAGWADGYASDSVSASSESSASRVASQASWLLGGGAVLTGGGLLALGWRIPGVVQLVVLGVGAASFSTLTAGG
ncbi:hypothetical protein GCM10010383_49970 [Streptomyces lomondensis]|uniref:Integral membrane protein n=1 Tax=Streptomyces lomondensis TaxID=68229 RepID=A0ABQ2XF20_9ACTN|nr:hypothetical protein GCM10010383_49970 [Streptomyces lomondensis]